MPKNYFNDKDLYNKAANYLTDEIKKLPAEEREQKIRALFAAENEALLANTLFNCSNPSNVLITLIELFPSLNKDLIFENYQDFELLIIRMSKNRIKGVVDKFPEHSLTFFNSIKNLQKFQEIISNVFDLINLAIFLPQSQEVLITHLLDNAAEFKRIIKDENHFNIAAPHFSAFNPPFSEVVKIVEQRQAAHEIKQNARLMGIVRKRENTLFSSLPLEVVQKIVKHTQESMDLSEKVADFIFDEEYKNGINYN